MLSFIHELKNRVPEYALAIDAVVGHHRIEPIIDEWGSTAGGNAVPQVLPVYSELAVNAGPVSGCSVDSYGSIKTGRYNKLGIRRYIRFLAESEGAAGLRPVTGYSSVPLLEQIDRYFCCDASNIRSSRSVFASPDAWAALAASSASCAAAFACAARA